MDFTPLTNFLDSLPGIGIPGVDCLVYYKHRPVYRHTAGWADVKNKREMTPDTLYNIYSLTKIATSVAALQLFEQGKFIMSDPLYEYIPEFKDMMVSEPNEKGEYIPRPAKNPICIQHLLTMTAGLTYDAEMPEIKEVLEKTNGKGPTLEIAKGIAKANLAFEPGAKWNYSLCLDVLGAFIEVVSGKKLGEYIEENILKPIGMKDSGFDETPERLEKMACQYEYNSETKVATEIPKDNMFRLGTEFQSGGAGIISSPNDYILFLDALTNGGVALNGEKILSRPTIDLMRTNHLDKNQLADFNWDALIGYGYGLGVRTMINKAAGGSLSSLGEFGWSGMGGCYALIDPDRELCMFYAQHMINNLEPYTNPRLRNLLYNCLDR